MNSQKRRGGKPNRGGGRGRGGGGPPRRPPQPQPQVPNGAMSRKGKTPSSFPAFKFSGHVGYRNTGCRFFKGGIQN